MRITVNCRSCAEDFSVKDDLAGERVKCKHCGTLNRVPTGASVASGGRSRSTSSKKRSSSSGDDTPWIIAGVGGGAGLLLAIVAIVMVASNRGAQTVVHTPPPAALTLTSTTSPVAPVIQVQADQSATETTTTPTAQSTTELEPVASRAPSQPENTTKPLPVLELPRLIQRVEPAVVLLEVEKEGAGSLGSGFVVSADGMTVTNHHVMAGAKKCTARFADGTEVNCTGFRLLRPREDIAVVQLDLTGKSIEPLIVAAEIPLKGSDVVGFGSPKGLSFTASTGIISGIRDSELLAEELGTDQDGMWLQTTCPTSEGSSGGPLCDRMGQVVAMNTMGRTDGQNLNFAISCIQIAEAIREAPEEVQSLDPKKIPEYESSIASRDLPKEIGTERGKRLMGSMKSATVIDPLPIITTLLDPRKIVNRDAMKYCRNAIERNQVELISAGSKPNGVYGILLVILDCEEPVKGRYGLQTLFVKLVLIVKDPAASSKTGKLSIVWKDEEKLGTIALKALAAGELPRTFSYQEGLYKLTQRLESSIRSAQNSLSSTADSNAKKEVPPASGEIAKDAISKSDSAKTDGDAEKPAAKKDDPENPFAPKSKK